MTTPDPTCGGHALRGPCRELKTSKQAMVPPASEPEGSGRSHVCEYSLQPVPKVHLKSLHLIFTGRFQA